MSKQIIISLAVIGVVAAVAIGGTIAYFSDTETSIGNTITAGSLDLTLNGYNGEPVEALVELSDMKPSQTWYSGPITLEIFDNPGRVYKHIVYPIECSTGDLTEPECQAENGEWVNDACVGSEPIDYLPGITWFDLEVWDDLNKNEIIEEDEWLPLIVDGQQYLDGLVSKWIYLGTYGYPQMTNKIVIRQSFHMDGEAGNQYQGDSCIFNEEFKVLQTNAPHPDPYYVPSQNVVLDSIDVGDSDSVSMVAHNAQGWLDYVTGNYGGRDGGESIAMVWGDGGFCDDTNDNATFELDAGLETATTLKLRHYDGQSNDSFEVFVNGVSVGTYANQNNSEDPSHWYTTDFTVNFSGKATIEIVATGPAGSLCAYHQNPDYYGQVALNWAKITN